MSNLKIPVSLIILVFLVFESCSKQKDTLTSQYWVRYKKSKPSYIVKFKENGDFINYNDLNDKLNYQIIQGRLIISDKKGESKKYFIKQIDDKVLELSRIDELGTKDIDFYRKAREQDLFLGKWISDNPSKFYYTSFENSCRIKIKININNYLGTINSTYKLEEPDIIIIDSIKYKYKFSEDLMRLKIIESNDINYNLKRKR